MRRLRVWLIQGALQVRLTFGTAARVMKCTLGQAGYQAKRQTASACLHTNNTNAQESRPPSLPSHSLLALKETDGGLSLEKMVFLYGLT